MITNALSCGKLRRSLILAAVPSTGFSLCGSSTTADKMESPRSKETLFYSALLKKRAIFLSGPVNEVTSSTIVAQLLYLEMEQPGI